MSTKLMVKLKLIPQPESLGTKVWVMLLQQERLKASLVLMVVAVISNLAC